ncbi:MAG: lipoyl(octanoyl) transferase LipB [Aeromonas sp.]
MAHIVSPPDVPSAAPAKGVDQPAILVRHLGRQPYAPTWQAMQDFCAARTSTTPDEIWLLEHEPVYTQGQAGRPEHLLCQGAIPLVHSDRGGQITYHGPGQLVAYVLLDLRRRELSIRGLVSRIESAIIATLAHFALPAVSDSNAPGVYVPLAPTAGTLATTATINQPLSETAMAARGPAKGLAKIASLGLKVRGGCTYHGLALNVAMDLAPFQGIHPCGFKALRMTQMHDFLPAITPSVVAPVLTQQLLQALRPAPQP